MRKISLSHRFRKGRGIDRVRAAALAMFVRRARFSGEASLAALSCFFWIAVLANLAPTRALALPPSETAACAIADQSGAQISEGMSSHDIASTDGSVVVDGKSIDYQATAGTIIVHPKGRTDASSSMFFVAYTKKMASPVDRPIAFLYNGGPGTSTMFLHLGAFGPKRLTDFVSNQASRDPDHLIDNNYSLLDASDLVFIDAPGTGFSQISGHDKEKGFYGVDQDVNAFREFIKAFLTRYDRWESPKYLVGESYGTLRTAILANALQSSDSIRVDGIVLLSEILNFDLSINVPQFNPAIDDPYIVALPTYAATTWYHNHVNGNRPATLQPLIQEVEAFANGDYALALREGNELDPFRRNLVAQKLSDYTGLPLPYVLKANLRINGGEFLKNLQQAAGQTLGRLDTRFSGPDLDPLSREAEYDPFSTALTATYTAAFNRYARQTLKVGGDLAFQAKTDVFPYWTYAHQPPGMPFANPGLTPNALVDLASAMKHNPHLKVMVNGGYFDLATPFYLGWYEMHHLDIPPSLQSNIEYHYYSSGHVIYTDETSLKMLHDNVAAFIKSSGRLGHQATPSF